MEGLSRVILTNYTNETIIILLSVLVIVFTILVAYWFHNRKKYRELAHQIPASIVKNYLDSIIQNSTALKSSLFRGGGLDVGEGVPSVVPVKDFPANNNVSVATASDAEINQKNAEISALNAVLQDKNRIVADLEKELSDIKAQMNEQGDDQAARANEKIEALKSELASANQTIEELKNQPAASPVVASDSEIAEQLAAVTKERDELKERLAEYEIIEDDIVNNKKLTQENAQLKRSLAALQGNKVSDVAEPVEEASVVEEKVEVEETTPEPAVDDGFEEAPIETEESEIALDAPVEENEDDLEAQMAAAIQEAEAAPQAEPEAKEVPVEQEVKAEETKQEESPIEKDDVSIEENRGDEHSPEELLSEFEKMLG